MWPTCGMSATTGLELWNYITPNKRYFSAPPIVMADDGVVFGTWDNVLVRLWPNGTQRWVSGPFDGGGGTFGYDQPAVDEKGIIYHVTYSFAVVAVHPLTGQVLWRTWLGYQTTSSHRRVRLRRVVRVRASDALPCSRCPWWMSVRMVWLVERQLNVVGHRRCFCQ